MNFTVYVHPQPQGSSRAFVRGGRAVITSDNAKLKPYRNEVTAVVLQACRDRDVAVPFAAKHIPVTLEMDFYFQRPASVSKKRLAVVVKPDIDKLARATLDSLTGVLFADDAQVVSIRAKKHYMLLIVILLILLLGVGGGGYYGGRTWGPAGGFGIGGIILLILIIWLVFGGGLGHRF